MMLTGLPCSLLDRNLPSTAAVVAEGSSSMSNTAEAIHSPRCPAATGR